MTISMEVMVDGLKRIRAIAARNDQGEIAEIATDLIAGSGHILGPDEEPPHPHSPGKRNFTIVGRDEAGVLTACGDDEIRFSLGKTVEEFGVDRLTHEEKMAVGLVRPASTQDHPIRVVYVCGGLYRRRNCETGRDEEVFDLVRPSGGQPPYVAYEGRQGDLLFRLCQNHSHLYTLNIDTGKANIVAHGDPRPLKESVVVDERILEEVRGQVKRGVFY